RWKRKGTRMRQLAAFSGRTNMKTLKLFVASALTLLFCGAAHAQIDDTNYGTGALASVIAGADYNSAFGFNALAADTTGQQNTGVGFKAMVNNTTGYDNTAVGPGSMFHNLDGYWNVAGGSTALYTNASGLYNTA